MNWRWISLTALLAALVAGYASLRHDEGSHVQDAAQFSPKYFLKDAVITQTREDGSPSMRLIAARIDQARTGDNIELTDVHVDFLETTQRQWVLTAKEGVVPEQSRIVQFKGDVHLRPKDSAANTFLRTDELSIDTEKNLAYTTTSPVDIRFGRLDMTVKRFEADLDTEKVKLEAIRGRSERG